MCRRFDPGPGHQVKVSKLRESEVFFVLQGLECLRRRAKCGESEMVNVNSGLLELVAEKGL